MQHAFNLKRLKACCYFKGDMLQLNAKYFLAPFIVFVFSFSSYSQIEKVIVEKYYVSDTTDAKDTAGGHLPAGSITYRIYIDMVKGCKLKKIYGDANHALKIISDSIFFNNMDGDGQTLGQNVGKPRYTENTMALDSWLTIGQATKTISNYAYFGILKSLDTNGSFVGQSTGIYANDGGSVGVPLLTNADTTVGIPISVEVGMDTLMNIPLSISWGISDSSAFGSLVPGNSFISYNAGLQNSGVSGVNADSNQVLIAQLTTKGKISFELNLQIEQPAIPNPITVNYVAQLAPGDSAATTPTLLSSFLSYPPKCGCKDPNYLEYSASYACSIQDSCKTPVVLGCMDTMACNYDPHANFNVPGLCCYPGYCSDRDLAVVCPSLDNGRFSFSPNPAQDLLQIKLWGNNNEIKYSVYDSFGKKVFEKNIGTVSGTTTEYLNVSSFVNGIYSLRVFTGNSSIVKFFLKN